MARKFLDLDGLKHFISEAIGKTDISKIGDGTCTGAISALNQSKLFFSNYQTLLVKIENKSYTATEDCMVYVETVTNNTVFGAIITKIGNTYCRFYQNPGSQENLVDGFLVALKKGDTISVSGGGQKSYKFYIYKK